MPYITAIINKHFELCNESIYYLAFYMRLCYNIKRKKYTEYDIP